jgi:hypothetical protein
MQWPSGAINSVGVEFVTGNKIKKFSGKLRLLEIAQEQHQQQ